MHRLCYYSLFFFFKPPATTEIYTLSLHDALPISGSSQDPPSGAGINRYVSATPVIGRSRRSTTVGSIINYNNNNGDRKSTRLNSSHRCISYAVFCLKKKKKKNKQYI